MTNAVNQADWKDILCNPVSKTHLAEDPRFPELTGNCLYSLEEKDSRLILHFGAEESPRCNMHPETDGGIAKFLKNILSDIPSLEFYRFKIELPLAKFQKELPGVTTAELKSLLKSRMERCGLLNLDADLE